MGDDDLAPGRRFWEAFNDRDLTGLERLFADDYVNHAALPGTPPGPEGQAELMERLWHAFPDAHFFVEHLARDGDTLICVGTMEGTHEGELMGLAPTHRKVRWRQCHLIRLDQDGKATEHRAIRDDAGLMRQMGIGPGGDRRQPEGRMSRENAELVRRAVDLWNRGDVEALVATFSEDAELEPAPGFIEGGAMKGRSRIRSFFERLHEGWKPGDVVALGELHEAGERVMFSFQWRATGDLSGIETSSEWIAVDTFREGLVVRMQIFSDRDEARDAAGLT